MMNQLFTLALTTLFLLSAATACGDTTRPNQGHNATRQRDNGEQNVASTPVPQCCREYHAGDFVPDSVVEERGANYFFTVSEIDDDVFARMRGRSYKADCPVKREDLRYLICLHRDAKGKCWIGEMVVNKAIAEDVLDILRQLFDARYPIERMRLIDEYDGDDEKSMRHNNTSAFNYRPVAGSTKLSAHARGMAIDINPRYNPYHKERNGRSIVKPAGSKAYLNREASFPYKLEKGDLCYRLFTAHGFTWGGNWRTVKDYQHFEIDK